VATADVKVQLQQHGFEQQALQHKAISTPTEHYLH